MVEFDSSDNNYEGSTDDEVAFMSRRFKQMMRKKGKFQHSSTRKDTRFKKKHKEKKNCVFN
ncbi:hypothetical protein JHK85_001256 [Glycine max]|nr:hypothetical protein JHK85_001256 [Glycine max]